MNIDQIIKENFYFNLVDIIQSMPTNVEPHVLEEMYMSVIINTGINRYKNEKSWTKFINKKGTSFVTGSLLLEKDRRPNKGADKNRGCENDWGKNDKCEE